MRTPFLFFAIAATGIGAFIAATSAISAWAEDAAKPVQRGIR